MSYLKNVWADRDVQYPNRYKDQNNNVLTLTRDEGTVNEAGTLFNAAKMNNIEDGIEALDTKLDEIVESGSNSNGSWTKWADGTMECDMQIPITADISLAWGTGLFYGYAYKNGTTLQFNFPQVFVEKPTLVITCYFNESALFATVIGFGYLTASYVENISLMRGTSNSDYSGKLHIIAKGKWK